MSTLPAQEASRNEATVAACDVALGHEAKVMSSYSLSHVPILQEVLRKKGISRGRADGKGKPWCLTNESKHGSNANSAIDRWIRFCLGLHHLIFYGDGDQQVITEIACLIDL